MASEEKQSKHVCVIGAGPSGIVSARELKKEGHSVVVLEQNHDIGGQWLYNPAVECEDPLGMVTPLKVHSSIYASLRLNTPKELISFSDFPFSPKKGRDMRRFPGHMEMFLYFKDFCKWFGVEELIRFNTRVEYVGLSKIEKDKWIVKSKEKESEKIAEEVFDAVVIATGQYSHPRIPSIKGMDVWKRKQMHSHVYRVPDPFTDEVVVVVGNSVSGCDISLELIHVAKEVHLCHRSLQIFDALSKVISKYENFHLHPQIGSLFEDGRVLFVDGSSCVADSIIYCTGFSFNFSFLNTEGIVNVDDDRVGPLYEHTFPPSLAPSLSFVGIPRKLLGPPFFEAQAHWIAQVLSGKRNLPSCDDMMKAVEEFYHLKDASGIPKHKTHDINFDFEYCDKYAENCGFPKMEGWKKEGGLRVLQTIFSNLENFRDQGLDEEEELIQMADQSK